MSLMSRQRSLKYRVAKAQGKVKQNRLQTAIMNIKNAPREYAHAVPR